MIYHPSLSTYNQDQTVIELVPTAAGQRNMNQAKDKAISIAHSDDKQQMMAVVATSVSGECIPIHLVAKER